MKRLYVFCEGQTEEAFVNTLLAPHFARHDATVIALGVSNKPGSNLRRHKGGWVSYDKAQRFIRNNMQQHHADGTWFTTMFDLYALPGDFPQPPAVPHQSARARVIALESAFKADLCTDKLWRFTPYLQLHEFEALILTDPDALSAFYPDQSSAVAALKADIAGLAPEAVDDGPDTAPSKRILRHFPEYDKVAAGTLVAMEIGLPKLRARCPHFGEWLDELERRTK